MTAKRKRRLHQVADGPTVGADGRVAAVRPVMPAREGRLVIERIDLAGRTVHEQEDAVLGLGTHSRRTGSGRRLGLRRADIAVARQEIDQRQSRKAGANLLEKITTGEILSEGMNHSG